MSAERENAIGVVGQFGLWAYGIVVEALALVFTGAGHGTYTLFGLIGSPFTAIPPFSFPYGFMVGLVAGTLQWGVLGTLFSRRTVGRKFLIAYLLVHYAVAAVLLTYPDGPFADWRYVTRVGNTVVASGFALYALGQAYLWWVILRKTLSRPDGHSVMQLHNLSRER